MYRLAALFVNVAVSMASDLAWTDAKDFGVRGRAHFTVPRAAYYDRLPSEAEGTVRSPVWSLSRQTAGMYVQFQTYSKHLVVNVTYTRAQTTMWHFASTGVAGLDLYAFDEATGKWRWTSTTRTVQYPSSSNKMSVLPGGANTRYRLHLPLYNGVTELKIGHDASCPLVPDPETYRQIVWYGTSITQGACASRPGMAFTNWISREIGHEILNFGFSGNGLMELNVAQYLVQVADPAMFVIDCSWNMKPDLIGQNVQPLVKYLREHHPTVPIVLAEDTEAGAAWTEAPVAAIQEAKRQNLRTNFDALVAAGDTNLHYVERESLYNFSDPDRRNSPTVGGTHPTDKGMHAITQFYKGFLPPLLKSARSSHSHGPVASRPIATPQVEMEETEGQDFEPELRAQATSSASVLWTDAQDLVIMGRAFADTPTPYSRLPKRAEGVVRDAVYSLSEMSTGLFVAFSTNSTSIALNYTVTKDSEPLWHMAASGTSGADLYRFDEDSQIWGFVTCLRSFPKKGQAMVATMATSLPNSVSRYLLYFPLRNAPQYAFIGVNEGAMQPVRDSAFSADGVTMGGLKPIVWYGTSIDQGGVVSRPGNTYTNILTRNLGRMVLNFGFAGNGKMELEVAQFLTEIDAAAIVIDCNWNMGAPAITNNTVPLVQAFRYWHPQVPIILASGSWSGRHWFAPAFNDDKREALKTEFEKLLAGGDSNLFFVENAADELFAGEVLVNPTVGGTHPTDLGHWEIASFYTTYFTKLLPTSNEVLSV